MVFRCGIGGHLHSVDLHGETVHIATLDVSP